MVQYSLNWSSNSRKEVRAISTVTDSFVFCKGYLELGCESIFRGLASP